MAKVYMDGLPVSGTANYASNVNCLDKDGNQSTVQAELDGLQENVGESNTQVSEQNKKIDDLISRIAVLEDKYGDFVPIETLSGAVSGSMSAYGSSGTVVFSTPFFNVPTVTASLKASETYINYSIGTVTRSGFTYTVYSSQHSSCSYTLSWIAEAEY